MRRFRARIIPLNHISRTTGLRADRGGGAEQGGPAPDAQVDQYSGETKQMCLTKDYDSEADAYTAKIDIDPESIVKTDEDDATAITIKPREIMAVESGVIKYRQVLASEQYGDSAGELATTPVTVITAIQYDSSSGYIQIKTRTLRAIDITAESSWTNAIETAECAECDEE
jgi:hypothetical protein